MPEPTEAELWQDEFGRVDLSSTVGAPELPDDNIPMIGPDLGNEPPTEQPLPAQPVQIMDTLPEPEPEEPQFTRNEDGSFFGMEKTPKGWKGTVNIGYGGSQDFYGKTKDELIRNILKAQFNASRKIREQNKKIKLGEPTLTETVQQAVQTVGRKLTADESFEIKTLFESDPDKALEQWFQKRTGSTPDELLNRANQGQQASNELKMEQANKTFLANNPTYYPDPNYENFNSLITYLAKHKLRRGRKTGDEQETLQALVDHGHYTAANLEEAFEDLTEAGLLLSKQQPPPAPPATPASDRIVRQETRPRAGLGIRPSETTQTRQPETQQPPSEKDLNKLTDKEIDELISQQRKAYLAGRR